MEGKFINPPIRELAEKQLFVFDLDGTLYLGDVVFDYAVRFIRHLRESGRRVMFFTNNASHSTEFYVESLTRRGFGASPEEILTPADVLSDYLHTTCPGQSVYVVGTEQLCAHLKGEGIRVVSGRKGEADPDIVVSSFDTELTYEKLCSACHFIQRGALYLCTHPDLNCPTDEGPIPDSGAIAAAIIACTGVQPRYFGKPDPEAFDMIIRRTGFRKEDVCVCGDRLYTDIALGTRNGSCSLLVLTGEATEADAETASPDEKPRFVFPSLDEADHALFG